MKNLKINLFLTLITVFVFGLTNVYSQFSPEFYCGEWGNNGTKILISNGNVTIKLAPTSNRPDGTGKVNQDGTITVNYPDDKTYTGRLTTLSTINWGGNNNWTRSKLTADDFVGEWGDNGTKILISQGIVTVKLAPTSNRPDGTGKVNQDGTITVNYPDDRTYTGKLTDIRTVNWGGNDNWTRSKNTSKYFGQPQNESRNNTSKFFRQPKNESRNNTSKYFEQPKNESKKHFLGEKFGGGIVISVSADGKHGLIAETVGFYGDYYSASQKVTDPNNHSEEGKKYTDWRVPTKEEFSIIYEQQHLFEVPLPKYVHWCSTNGTDDKAYVFCVNAGAPLLRPKTMGTTVRPVRSF